MKPRLSPALALVLLAFPAIASADDGLPIATLERDTPVDFAKEVVPFLKKNCFACHNEKKAKADLNLESPKAMMAGGDSGPALVPGNATESLVFTYAAHLEFDPMPPAKNKANAENLTPDELALLKLWIEQGAKGASASVLAGPTEWRPLDDVFSTYAVAISHDGRFAACGRGNRLYVYDLQSGQLTSELIDRGANMETAHHDFVHSLAFNQHGLLASGGYRTVKLWSAQRNPATKLSHPLAESATSLATSPDGDWLAAGDAQGQLTLRSLDGEEKGQAVKVHEGAVRDLLVAPDGQTVFSAAGKTVARTSFPDSNKSSKITLPAEVHALALFENNTKLAAGGADGVIRVYPLSVFEPLPDGQSVPPPLELKGHTGSLLLLRAVAADKNELLSVGEDGTARVWDASGKELRQISHGGAGSAAAFHQSSGLLATGGADGVVRLWNVADGKKLHELQGDPDAEFQMKTAVRHRDLAKNVAELRRKKLEEREKRWNELRDKSKEEAAKVASAKKELESKDAAAREKRDTADFVAREVAVLEASKDPDLAKAKERAKKADEEADKAQNELVTAERAFTNAVRTRDLAVQDGAKAGERYLDTQAASAQADAALAVAEEALKALESNAEAPSAGTIQHLSFSPDGKTLAVASEKGGLRLWSATTGNPLDVIDSGLAVNDLCYSPDGRLIATLPDETIATWREPVTWVKTQTIGSAGEPEIFPDRVLALAFHPRGHLLATGSGIPSRSGELRIWRVADGEQEGAVQEAHLDTITGLAFSPNGAHIASASTDRYLKIHDVQTGALLDQLEGHTNHVLDVAWSADGETLASAGADHVAKLWAVETSKQKKTESGFKKELSTIAFLGNGENFVTGGGDKLLKAAGQNLPGIDDIVYDVDATPDGDIIVAGGENGILRVWRASDRQLLHSFEPPRRSSAATAAK